ncbi:MAG: YceI family protein [Solirubrobacteraceae bacterium]
MSDLQAATDRRDHSPGLPLSDGVWTVDPQRSEIGFAVKALWGLHTVRGVFGAYDGTLTVQPGGTAGKLTIEAASLDTGHGKRDRHLRSPDFFDVEPHPQIVFTATSVTALQDGLTVEGELTIASTRLRLVVPVKVERMPDGATRLSGRTTVAREAAGMTWNRLGSVDGDAVLHADLTLTRAQA